MKNTVLLLRENSQLMNSTERKIADYVLSHMDQVAQMSIQELAKATFTSASTIYRMCCNLGFQGYKEFKQALFYDVVANIQKSKPNTEEIVRGDPIERIIEKVTYRNIASLEDTKRLMDPRNMEQCVSLLEQARTVLLFGIGASFGVARDAYLKFLRINKSCVINEDWHSQLLMARNARADDLGIVLSYSGETVEMMECMKEMRKNRTPVILITRYASSPAAKLADYSLYAAAPESLFRSGAMSSRIAQLNVIDILYTAFACRQYDQALDRLSKTHINKKNEFTQP